MTHFLHVCLRSFNRKHSKDVCGTLLRYNVSSNIRTLTTTRSPFTSFLSNRNITKSMFCMSLMKDNRRFNSEKAQDRFIPKDPFRDVNLWKSVLIVLSAGGVITAFMLYLKNEKLKIQEKERKRAIGKADIGGKFELVDENNKLRKSDDFLGQWLLIYFGFTHCPDICPDEMEKIGKVVDKIEKDDSLPNILPIFITVDPERDSPSVVGKYVKEFSDKFIGLTGSRDQIEAVCKAYRVYLSSGPKDQDSDYIVDHTIITYLVDPNGETIDYFGQNKNVDQMADGIKFNMKKFLHLNPKGIKERLFS